MIPAPFRIANYRAYWLARLCATIGQVAMVIVIGWQVYDLARQTMGTRAAALQLGFVGLAQFLPLFLLTLVAGWAADHFDRRWIGRASVALELICATLLGWLTASGEVSLPWLFGIAALLGVARAFAAPAFSALAPNLVPRMLLPQAIGLSAIAWQTGAVTGPAFGGYLYAHSPAAPYIASCLLFAVSLACLMLISRVPAPVQLTEMNPVRRVLEGLHYVRTNRFLLGAITLDLFAVLLGGATGMLPVYARDILQVGPEGLGHLRAAPAVGAIAAAAWFAARPLKTDVGVKMLLAVALFGLATIVFGLSRSMWLSLLCMVVLGAADMVSVNVRQSLIQLRTPDPMRGRVGAVSTLAISASNELGEAESGFLAALVGPVAAVVAGGIGAIAIVGLWWRWFPELRLAKTFDPPAPAADAQQEAKA